jgi:hypothetical protein
MSLIGDVIGEFLFEAFGALLWRLFHATGRRLVLLLTFGGTHIPSAGRGGGERPSDFWAAMAGLLFWLGIISGAIYWALA